MAQRISPCYVISLSISYAKIRAPNSGFTTNDSRLAGMTRILLTSSLDTLFRAIALGHRRAAQNGPLIMKEEILKPSALQLQHRVITAVAVLALFGLSGCGGGEEDITHKLDRMGKSTAHVFPDIEDYYGTFVLDENNAWAVGNRGVIIHITDKGEKA